MDTQAALKVLGGGLAGSAVLNQKGANMLGRSFPPGFRIALHHKDLGIVTSAAREAGVVIPLGAVVAQLMAAALANGDGGLDHSALLRGVLRLSGRTPTPRPPPTDHPADRLNHNRRNQIMPTMRAVDAAIAILEKEGVDTIFGLPGAAINPLYSAMRDHGGIKHILARHVEGASHMAEGYTRARAGNIGVCVGTSGPAGTDMITGLYSASADSIPILCITGQAPVARLHKEDFQAINIADIAAPVDEDGDDRAGTGAGARRVRAGVPPDALRPARPGADRPAVRRADGADRVRPGHLHPTARVQARRVQGAGRQGAGHARRRRAAGHRGRRRHHQRRRLRPAGRAGRVVERAGHPDPDGLGQYPGRSPVDGRAWPACRPPTSTATPPCWRRISCSASATGGPTGRPAA